METKLTNEESLGIIHQMIATSKNNLKDNSFFFLLWGWLVLAASLSHFVLLQLQWSYAFLPWPILMNLGVIISIVAGYRMGKKTKVMSHIDKMMIYLWYGFLAVILILISMALLGRLNWITVYPTIIVLYGLGTFVSGGVLKFKPLILGGIACWLIAITAFFVQPQYVLLLTALSIIMAYLIPGYLLKSKS